MNQTANDRVALTHRKRKEKERKKEKIPEKGNEYIYISLSLSLNERRLESTCNSLIMNNLTIL
jgi:hypothetical protein